MCGVQRWRTAEICPRSHAEWGPRWDLSPQDCFLFICVFIGCGDTILLTAVTWVEMNLHVSRDLCAAEPVTAPEGPLDKAGGDAGGDSGPSFHAPAPEGAG